MLIPESIKGEATPMAAITHSGSNSVAAVTGKTPPTGISASKLTDAAEITVDEFTWKTVGITGFRTTVRDGPVNTG